MSELMRPQPSTRVLNWFAQQSNSTFYTNAITQAELLLGDKQRVAFADSVERMFDHDFAGCCLPFDEMAAHEYAALVTLQKGMTLTTRNTKDFLGIDRLVLLDPWFALNP